MTQARRGAKQELAPDHRTQHVRITHAHHPPSEPHLHVSSSERLRETNFSSHYEPDLTNLEPKSQSMPCYLQQAGTHAVTRMNCKECDWEGCPYYFPR